MGDKGSCDPLVFFRYRLFNGLILFLTIVDLFQVLASAAQELSQPTEQVTTNPTPAKKIVEVEEETWQSIVQRRIETKTRRFSKGKSKPEPQATVNRFVPVAGHFFYPLMTKFDRYIVPLFYTENTIYIPVYKFLFYIKKDISEDFSYWYFFSY